MLDLDLDLDNVGGRTKALTQCLNVGGGGNGTQAWFRLNVPVRQRLENGLMFWSGGL